MKFYQFRSQSTPEKVYETRLWSDGRTTCNCPGWTRRTQPDGQRLCVHTRLVTAGNAESDPLFISGGGPIANGLKMTCAYKTVIGLPAALANALLEIGYCDKCGYLHFPEFVNCNALAYSIPDYPTQPEPPAPTAKEKPLHPIRKFSFD